MGRNESGESTPALGSDAEEMIQALEAELASVSAKADRKILWGVLGLIVFVILYKLVPFDPVVFIIVIPIAIFGGIALVIFENARKKRMILIKRGFRCPECGYLPHPINASGLYYSPHCPKCRTALNI